MYAPLCGVWLANEIYEHYLNGGLDAERDTVLEIVRQAALFIMDYLAEHDGCYVSCPSASPEAVFDRNGRCALGLHSAFENGLARTGAYERRFNCGRAFGADENPKYTRSSPAF